MILRRPIFALALATLTGCLQAPGDPENDSCPRAQTARPQDASDGACVGSATSCSSISAINCVQDGCTVDIGYYDDPYDDRCEGYPKDCDELKSSSSCSYQMGCSWKSATGEPEDPTTGGGSPCLAESGGAGGAATPGNPPGDPSGAGGAGGSGVGGAFAPGGSGGASSDGAGGASTSGGNPSGGNGGGSDAVGGASTSGPGDGGTGGGWAPPEPP